MKHSDARYPDEIEAERERTQTPPAKEPPSNGSEREALTGCDTLLSELVRQRGAMKLCYDERDGWFVQFQHMHQRDAWITLDHHEERHASPTAAIKAARLAHNDEVERQRKSGRCAIHQIIPDND